MTVGITALVEIKLAKNTKFWAGLERQLPKYLEAEEVRLGRFLIVTFTEADVARLNDIYERVSQVKKNTGYEIEHCVVECVYRPPSASKL